MTAQTATLTDFLLARIAEDEAVARASHPHARWWADGPGELTGGWWVYDAGAKAKRREDAEHIARHDPARVLAECEAKRRIVRQLDLFLQGDEQDPVGADEILLALALPYADHPDFREEWRA